MPHPRPDEAMKCDPERGDGVRKIYMFVFLSLDGYFEGPNHDLSWHNVDDEFNEFAIKQLKETDLLLFGRRIYQVMEAAWPKIATDPSASADNLVIAKLINNVDKIVYSRTLRSVHETENWRNVRLVHKFDPAEIRRLKLQSGKDISVGGPNLALSFIEAGLVDEFRFMMTPVVIGRGTPIFEGMRDRMNLELTETQKFDSGNVLLYYRPSDRA